MRGVSRWLLLALIVLLPVWGGTIPINFDGLSGAWLTLTFTNGEVTVTITRIGGVAGSIETGGGWGTRPAGFGSGSLSPSPTTAGNPYLIVVTLTGAGTLSGTGLSAQFGDSGADTDTAVVTGCTGADGVTGCTFSGSSASYSGALPTIGTVSVLGVGIQSFILTGGSAAFPMSVIFDNVVIDYDVIPAPPPPDGGDGDGGAIPEPGTMAIMASGLLALGYLRRRS